MFEWFKKNKNIEQTKSATYQTYVYSGNGASIKTKQFKDFAQEGYIDNVVVYKCIKLIADCVGYVELKVFNGDKELTTHPLITLLQKPNEKQSYAQFIEDVISYKLIAGNSYIEKSFKGDGSTLPYQKGMPVKLYSLPPQYMQIETNKKTGFIDYYKFNDRIKFLVDDEGRSNIIHIKTFHPTDNYYGLSAIAPAAFSIDQHNEAGKWNLSMLQNGCRPSGALSMQVKESGDGKLTDEQYNRLKVQMEDQYSGSKNAGKPLLLEGGLQWQDMSLSPRDMDFLNAKNSAARDIALAFGVPAQLIGIEGDSTYNNMAEASLAFWERTVLPLLDSLIDDLNNGLATQYSDKIKIQYDVGSIEALEIKRQLKAQSLNDITFLTVNEKREAMGYDSHADGDNLPRQNVNNENNLSKQRYIATLVNKGIDASHAEKMAELCYADKSNGE